MYATMLDTSGIPNKNGKAKYKREPVNKSKDIGFEQTTRTEFLTTALEVHGLTTEYVPQYPFKLWWHGSG